MTEIVDLGRTLKKHAADVLAYFNCPGTSNGPTNSINGPSNTSGAPHSATAPDQLPGPEPARDRRLQNAIRSLNVNFSGGGFSTVQIPAVPNWTSTAGGTVDNGNGWAVLTPATTLPYTDTGTATTGPAAHLYTLRATVTDPGTVTSITLPSYGSALTTPCSVPTLHVLAATAG